MVTLDDLIPDRKRQINAFFTCRCPNCGAVIEQRTEAQNGAFHMICTALAKQLDWPRGSGRYISVVAWKRLLVAAWARSQERKAEIYPSIDRDGYDVVYERTSRMSRQEFRLLIPYAEAWAVDQGVVMPEREYA